jgi:hypothetical protein
MKSVPGKPATMQVALSAILPFVVGCVPLESPWSNRVVFRRTNTLLPFLAAVAAILFVWMWQRQAFTMLAPHSGLTYGYFLTPEGAKARFWVLTCPFRVGLTCLSICFIAALVSAWRADFRSLLASIIP